MYIYGHSPRSLITESLDVQSNQFILLCDVCEHSFCEQCFPVLQCEDCGLYKCGPCDEVKNTAALHVIFSSDLDEILFASAQVIQCNHCTSAICKTCEQKSKLNMTLCGQCHQWLCPSCLDSECVTLISGFHDLYSPNKFLWHSFKSIFHS
jgi:hypothetical protein